jgi:hypothetical protein
MKFSKGLIPVLAEVRMNFISQGIFTSNDAEVSTLPNIAGKSDL